MGKAGGIISIIGGIFGFIAAITTLLVGGLGAAFKANGSNTIVGFGWGGIVFSFLVIVFGAIAFARPRGAGILLIFSSILGAILGGTLVAVCMVLSLLGGILAVFSASKSPSAIEKNDSAAANGVPLKKNTWIWLTGAIVFGLIAVFAAVQKTSQKSEGSSRGADAGMGAKVDLVLTQRPSDETGFIRVIADAQQKSSSAENDMQRGGIKAERDKNVCQIMQTPTIQNWTGKIKTIDSTSDGKGVLGVEIADHIVLKTWNNALSDIGYGTVLEPGSPVFTSAASMKQGIPVAVTGSFFRVPDSSSGDCFKESSVRLTGKLQDPEFIFKFESITLLSNVSKIPNVPVAIVPIKPVADTNAPVLSSQDNALPVKVDEHSMPTRAGNLSIKGSLNEMSVYFEGKKLRDGDGFSLNFINKFSIGQSDAVLVMNNSGGTACPVQYFFITTIVGSANAQVSPEFGTCSDQPQITQKGTKIVVSMKDGDGKNVTYSYENGIVNSSEAPKTTAEAQSSTPTSQAISGVSAAVEKPITAPSFDCSKAVTGAEKLVCSNESLAQLDLQLMHTYKGLLDTSSDKEELRKKQNFWRKKQRDICATASCVATAYQERIADLALQK